MTAISPETAPATTASPDQGAHKGGVDRSDIARVLLVVAAAVVVWFHLWEPVARWSVIGLAAMVIGGWPIFKEAVENLLARRMTMELSMTIALVAALLIGQVFTALVITAFVLVAEILEGLTVSRGRQAIRSLLDFLPRTATLRRGARFEDVPLQAVGAGDVVLVRPGACIPVDGMVLKGRSFVEEAAITGEPLPVEKLPGAAAYAGTTNQSGILEVRADRLGADTTFGKIVEAVERAERSRAPIQRTADRLAAFLVYFAIGAALLTLVISRDIRATISVVIVAGACGVAAGTPLAILGGIGQSARRGAIVKGGRYLETLAAVDTVVLDKTGTLTYGHPRVSVVRPGTGVTAEELMAAAAAAEGPSEHPLGKAIVTWAVEQGLHVAEAGSFRYTPGRGVVAEVDGEPIAAGNRALFEELGVLANVPYRPLDETASEVLVARQGRFLGAIDVTDVLRPEARTAVRTLRALGIKTILLSGDRGAVAEALGRELLVDTAEGGLLPEGKMQRVADLVRAGRVVAMVGDGINDAPALAEASVGVAMGSGTDVARESADVVLIGNDLSKFVDTLRIARQTRRTIRQNFAGTLAVDTVGIALAAAGLLTPLLAAFIHVTSELTFILNSARLLPRPKVVVSLRRDP
jgi:P-type Cu+ transporter